MPPVSGTSTFGLLAVEEPGKRAMPAAGCCGSEGTVGSVVAALVSCSSRSALSLPEPSWKPIHSLRYPRTSQQPPSRAAFPIPEFSISAFSIQHASGKSATRCYLDTTVTTVHSNRSSQSLGLLHPFAFNHPIRAPAKSPSCHHGNATPPITRTPGLVSTV